MTAGQWLRDGVPIEDATGSTYLPGLDDLGAMLIYRSFASGLGGTIFTDSEPVGPVAEALWVTAARIDEAGWWIELDIIETRTGGSFNLAAITVTSHDLGFSLTTAPIVRQRSIRVTDVIRKPHPNSAEDDVTTAGGVSTYRLALAKQMFAKAKAGAGNSGVDPTVTLAAGWYVDEGTSAPPQINFPVTNQSIEPYPQDVFRNALPPFRLLGATAIMEITGSSVDPQDGRTIAAARCDLTGVTSGITVSQTVTAMIASDYFPQHTVASPVFRAALDTTPLTQGEQAIERWRTYPFIGDTPFDTQGRTLISGQFADHEHTINHAGTFAKVFAVVDPVTGNDGTGVASTVSEAAAAVNPFATDAGAWAAARALNLSAHGRNTQSGIEICFSDTTHTLSLLKAAADDAEAGGTWCIYRPVTGANNCIIARDTGSNLRTVPRRTCLRGFAGLDLVGSTTGVPIFLDGGETNTGTYGQAIWIDNSPFIDSQGTNSTVSALYRCGFVYLTDADQPALGANTLHYTNVRNEIMLIRDMDFASLRGTLNPWAYIGVSMNRPANAGSIVETPTTNTNRILPNTGQVFAGFRLSGSVTTGALIRLGNVANASGIAMLNVLIESFGTTQPALFVSGDGSNFRFDRFFADYVTVVGERTNFGYEDTFVMTDDGDPRQQLKRLMMFRRSVLREANTKIDVFAPANGARLHAWNVAWRVGWDFVRFLEAASDGSTAPGINAWTGEAWPSTIAYLGPDARSAFVDYRANHRAPAVTGTGGGNYMPAAGSPLLGVIPAGSEACPVDLFGNARNGAIGAIERVV